MLNLEELLD